MRASLVSRKAFHVLAVIAVVLAASLLWGTSQAHAASSTVAYVLDSGGTVRGSYDDLQAAFDAVGDGESVELAQDIDTRQTYEINRGKTFELRLSGHTITCDATTSMYILRIENGDVTIRGGTAGTKKPGLIGTYTARCIYLKSGRLSIETNNDTVFRGGRAIDMYGGELDITGGTFENSIFVYNSAATLNIAGGRFGKNVNISAKDGNACTMSITGGEFLARLTNTGKTGFITGGTFHYQRVPNDEYIHPDYCKVKDTITREGQTEEAYRIEKRPPSVAFSPESGSVEYDPAGSGTEVTAKVVDADGTTELDPATFKWYKGDEPVGESQTVKLNEAGTYKAVATYQGTTYEATYEVKPVDISSGYVTSLSQTVTFTGFPFGKDFVQGNAKLYKDGSATPIEGFTFDVKSTGENINTGTGTYTIKGTGNYTGELSGSFNIAQANFGDVTFTVSPTILTYTGASVQPMITGTLTTADGKVHTLDPSEYTVAYDNNINVGEATVTVTSGNKNFSTGTRDPMNFTINKAPNEVSVSIEGWASAEAAKTPNVTASFGAGNATIEYKAKGAADSEYVETVPSTSGEYTVRATIAGTDNYEAGVATADFTITPFTPTPKQVQTISADEVIATYGDTDQKTINARVTVPTEGGGTLSYAVTSGSDCIAVNASTGALTIKRCGQATVTVTASATDTYAQTTKDVAVTIGKAETAPATVTASGWTYDGTERRLVVAEGAVSGGTMQYVVGDSAESAPIRGWSPSIPTATNAGTYYVWYKVKGDENHNDSGAQPLEVTVAKADPVVSAPGPLNATCGDLLESVKLPKADNGVWSWDAPDAQVESAGVNNFVATFTPEDTTNYNSIAGVPVVVNTAKGQSSVATKPEGKALTYNGAMQALATPGTAEGGTLVYALDGEDYVDEPSAGIVAGNYTVWYMVAGDENHLDTQPQQVTATIAKADPTVTAPKATNPTYTGEAQALVEAGTAEGGEMQYSLDGKAYSKDVPTGADAGTYHVWYRVIGDENHNDTEAKRVDVTIGPKPAVTYGITVAPGITGGAVEVDDAAAAGATVTVRATPDEGYELASVTVTDADGKAVEVRGGSFTMPARDVTVSATFARRGGPEPAKPTYAVTSGSGSAWAEGSDGRLTFVFKRSEGDEETFGRFRSASVDGKLLTRDRDYTATAGSLVIELAPAYLATLAAGEHTLAVEFDDGGTAEAKFTVTAEGEPEQEAEPTPAPKPEQTPEPRPDQKPAPAPTPATPAKASALPRTGDPAPLAAAATVAAAGAALAAAGLRRRRKDR